MEQLYLGRHPGVTPGQLPTDPIDIIAATWDAVFSFDFPIWDSEDKEPLCMLILQHYYMREIGQETYGLWKARLRSWMMEHMPYYVEMWEAQQTAGNWFINKDYNRKYNKAGKENHIDDVTTHDTTDRTSDGNTSNTSHKGTTGEADGSASTTDKTITDGTSSGTSKDTTSRTGKDTTDGSNSGTNNSTTTYNSTEDNNQSIIRKHSDTPQDGLAGVMAGTYLSAADVDSVDTVITHGGNDRVSGDSSGTNHSVTDSTESGSANGETTGKFHQQVDGTSQTTTHNTFSQDEDGNATGTTHSSGNETSDGTRKEKFDKDYSEGYNEEVKGWDGDKVDAMLRLQESYMNIPAMIIADMSKLFISILG